MNLLELNDAVIRGDSHAAFELTEKALMEGVSPDEILNKGLIPGLQKVGNFFEKGHYFLPELIVAGDAVSKAMELLHPLFGEENAAVKGKYLIGTVQDDLHDVGKNIVIMMLKGNGWDVTDLGVDVSPSEFCSAVEKGDYQIVGLSCLLTMTMPNATETIEALKSAGVRDNIKIMVGGAPTSPQWAERIGADAHASNGSSAARIAAALIGK